MKHCEAPTPPLPTPHPLFSIGGRRWGVGTVVPLVRRRVVHLHRVEEFVAIEAAHSVDCFAEHGQACVAARRRHAAQHPPFVAGGVVHFHAAEGVGAIETANNKQFAWTETQCRLPVKTCPATTTKKSDFLLPDCLAHLHGQQYRLPCGPHSWGLPGSKCCSQGCNVPQSSSSSTTQLLQPHT